MADKIVYEIPPELETETVWVCATKGCGSICFDQEFAEQWGCALHHYMVREVRQFENGKLISCFKASSVKKGGVV